MDHLGGSEAIRQERERIGMLPLLTLAGLCCEHLCIINEAGVLLLWNRNVEASTQLSADELAAIHVADLFGEMQRAMVRRKLQEVLLEDNEIQLEADLMAKDGSARPYLLSASRFQHDGRYYVFWLGQDISLRRKGEETSCLRERALHATINGVVITRCEGRDNPIEYVNPAFERITGYTAEEAVGNDSRFMAAPGLDEAERAQLRDAIQARHAASVVFRNLRKNGELFWNELAITPVTAVDGRVTHYIGVINDVTERKQHTSHLEHEVNHDPLTGLANRNLLWDRLEHALHAAQRSKALVGVMLVDLNSFKQINDTLGHETGDEVLKMVARRLQASVRDSDTVARLSGDEFVLVLAEQPSLRFTMRMVERLRAGLLKPLAVASKEIVVGASMGVSIYPHDAANAFDLVRAADVAMYHAMTRGESRVNFFSADMRCSSEARNKMENDMRHAVGNNELFLLYQPRWSLDGGVITGIEALLRWRHPELGVLLPNAFLADAEENGLVIPLGQWVAQQACATMERLATLGHDALPLAVNASYREFIQDSYLPQLCETLARYRVLPQNFQVDVREDHLMRNPQLCRDVVLAAEARGIGLTVAEFGAGACNLPYLQSMPLAHLKMTGSAVRDIGMHTDGGILARTLVGIAHSMGTAVVAAGVETDGQRAFLSDCGCDQAQGHFYSAPLDETMLEQLLGAQDSTGPHAPGA